MRTPIAAALAVLALTGASVALREAGPAPAGHGEHSPETVGSLLRRHGPGAPVMVATHRGYRHGAPENSLGAITQSVAHGAQVIELHGRGVPA